MKPYKFISILLLTVFSCIYLTAQNEDKNTLEIENKAKNLVYSGNEYLSNDNFVSAEMEFRKAISEMPTNVEGAYNLGYSYYQNGAYQEALFRHQLALKHATTKQEKHYAYHSIGNILMQDKKCQEAAEAFKNALKNNPSDDETRYNYVLAKVCAEQQDNQQNQDNKDQDKQDENKEDKNQDNKDNEGDKEQDNKDQNQEDKNDEGQKDKEGEDKQDEKKNPDPNNQDKQDNKEKQNQPPKQQPGKLSPQQVKNLLEAMNAQEQKVQEKINAKKQEGIKIKTEKDW